MATLTIKIAASGTVYDANHNSLAGHMWISVDSDGVAGPMPAVSMGFAPIENLQGLPLATGKVYPDDDQKYGSTYYTGTIIISATQYDQLIAFGSAPSNYGFSTFYNVLTNSCIDFTWKALEVAGLNSSSFNGDLWPTWNADNIDRILYTYLFKEFSGWQSDKSTQGNYDVIYGSGNDDTLQAAIETDAVYGGDGNDILTGNILADHLYGTTGNDTLSGGNGNDYLEGGQGVDIYQMASYDGIDTILDTDGQGQITVDGATLTGQTGVDPAKWIHNGQIWQDRQHQINYAAIAQADGTQDLSISTMHNTIVIKNWHAGELGITLGNSMPQAPATITYNGDQRAPLNSNKAYDWSVTRWAANGTLTGGVAEANFNDVIYGTLADEILNGLGGNDALDGGAGNDTVNGGVGDDLLAGGAGSDVIYGGAGNDEILSATTLSVAQRIRPDDSWQTPVNEILWIKGSNWGVTDKIVYGGGPRTLDNAADIVFAGDGGDDVTGGLGNDYLDGGLNNDDLTGQGGNDIINGGDGNDGIRGDGTILPGFYETIIESSHGNDTLDGGAGADIMLGNGQNDVLFGGIGNDKLWGDDSNERDLAGQYHGNDYVDGGEGDDELTGGGKDDILMGGAGNDNLYGDATIANLALQYHGNDLLDGGEGDDYINGQGGNDVLRGGNGIDLMQGGDGNDLVDGGAGDDSSAANGNTAGDGALFGGAGDDTLYGRAGRDELIGEAGIDLLDGGIGDDLLFGADGDDTLLGGDGHDQLQGGNDNDVLDGDAGDDILFGEAGNDTLQGNNGNDHLAGQEGDDSLTGGVGADYFDDGLGDDSYLDVTTEDTVYDITGNDTLVLNAAGGLATMTTSSLLLVDPSSMRVKLDNGDDLNILDVFFGSHFNLRFGTGGSVDLETHIGNTLATAINLQLGNSGGRLYGGAADDTLRGGTGNDNLNGYKGNDLLVGGAGNDIYSIDSLLDVVVEAANEGTDTVQSSISYALAANSENLTLMGADAINGTGNSLDNVLTGNNALNILTGGQGSDIYVIDVNDSVIEAINEGTDTIRTGASYTLGANIENLTLTGSLAIDGTGNMLNNALTGNGAANSLSGGNGNDILTANEGADILDGGTGEDTLTGGTGNDRYVVDNVQDVVIESLNEGTDNVQSSVTYTLAANVESLLLTGTTTINGTGNALNNTLTGNTAANTLSGGAGIDTLNGGLGNDLYVVDNIGDVVSENLNAGVDTIQSSVTYTLAANVENLTLTGATAINGTGNALNNTLTGNTAANTLSGGAGIDTLNGGLGNDLYVVDNIGDVVSENLNAGVDTAQSSVTYTLAANVESLLLTGATAINGTGNALNNIVTGNAAANTLSGGAGIDTLNGGLGNDLYVVDNIGDVVSENLNAGVDTVQSSVTYTLAANVESLLLTGATTINGTGNALNNTLTGNTAANTLSGGAGIDTLNGGLGNDLYIVDNALDLVTEALNAGVDTVQSSVTYALAANVENLTLTGATLINGTGNALGNLIIGNSAANSLNGGTGNDTLTGGAGADHFKFSTVIDSTNVDTLTDFVSGTDKIDLSKAVFTAFSSLVIGSTLNNAEIGNHLRYTATTGALSYDADGAAGIGAAIQIAIIGSAIHPASLLGTDFNIVA